MILKVVLACVALAVSTNVARADLLLAFTSGTFTTTGTNVMNTLSFTGTSFNVPQTATSLNVIIGTLNHPMTIGPWLGSGGSTPDFNLTVSVPNGTSHTFKYDMSGAIYDAWGLRGTYDFMSTDTGLIPFTYTTATGTGSFNLKLVGLANPSYPGLVSLGPGGHPNIGALITNATFTENPIAQTPEVPTWAMMMFIGAAVLTITNRQKRSLTRA